MLDSVRQSALITKCRASRKCLIFIVYVALFLDNMLLTTVVPIIPEYLYHIHHPNESLGLNNEVTVSHSVSIPGATSPPQITDSFHKTLLRPQTYAPLRPTELPPFVDSNFPTENPWWVEDSLINYPKKRSARGHSWDSKKDDFSEVGEIGSTTTESPTDEELRREHLLTENVEVGIMFGSKALLQLITNPFVGPVTNRLGYTIPMFTGFVVMFFSTVLFAFGTTYAVLFVARTFQGIGSACTSTSGMGMIAQAYTDDQERGAAMGVALGGLALGVLAGPPYGGILYQYSGKELPFLLLALLALFDGTLQFLVLQPKVEKGEQEATALKELLKDPYIIIAAGSITIGNLGIAMLEPTLPIWMMLKMKASPATRGAAFLPASISYLIGTNIFGPLAHKIGRWLSAMIGLIVIGICLIAIPSATDITGLIAPNGFMGFAIGMIDASMFPQMGFLVDLRHTGVYGSVYAIADAAFCMAFAIGPYVSGPIIQSAGFPKMCYSIAVISFLYAPLMLLLRNPPQIASEKQQLLADDEVAATYEENREAAHYEYDY